MAAKFKRGDLSIYIGTLPRRKCPALIVDDGTRRDIVANFKSDEAAKLFVVTLERIVKKNGKRRPDTAQ